MGRRAFVGGGVFEQAAREFIARCSQRIVGDQALRMVAVELCELIPVHLGVGLNLAFTGAGHAIAKQHEHQHPGDEGRERQCQHHELKGGIHADSPSLSSCAARWRSASLSALVSVGWRRWRR